MIPRRRLGRSDLEVSILGLGGLHLARVADEAEAIALVHEALDAGLNFFETAWENGDEERLGRALRGRRDDAVIAGAVCTHGRGADEAVRQLDDTLRRLQTDHLDIWQIHEVSYDNEPAQHFAADGVAAALERAKAQGKVRMTGFSGHKHPSLHLQMLAHPFAFDTCQLPLNPLDANFRSFEGEVLPQLLSRGIAPIGMKPLAGGEPLRQGVYTAEEGLRYAMSLPVATTLCGIDNRPALREALAIARDFIPLDADAMAALRLRCAPFSRNGRLELYKTSMRHEQAEGRKQHGMPTREALPL